MSERRAVPRVPLTVPATIYDGETEIHCKTRDISRGGVAVAGVPKGLPTKAVRLRISEFEGVPSVLCDCFPVAGRTETLGLQFLAVPGDLPGGLQKLLEVVMKENKGATRSQSATQFSRDFADQSTESDNSQDSDLQRRLKDLYSAALDSLD